MIGNIEGHTAHEEDNILGSGINFQSILYSGIGSLLTRCRILFLGIMQTDYLIITFL